MTDASARITHNVTAPGEPLLGVSAARLSRRGLLTAFGAGTIATGAMVLGSSTIAEADSTSRGRSPIIDIDVTTAGGFTLPAKIQAGIVTFRITAHDTDSHALQGFQVGRTSTLDAVLHDIDRALLGTFPERAIAATNLLNNSTFIGGAVTFPSRPIVVTVALEPGTYHFVDFNDVGNIPPRVQTMRVVGHFRWSPLPGCHFVIRTKMENDEPRFITPTALKAKGTYLFSNDSDEIHEVVFRATVPGTTDDYVTTFYNAVLAGTPRPPSPWTDVQHGLQAISPGRWAIFSIDLPPGPYSEICYVPDDTKGFPHAYEGMHNQVTLS